MAETYTLEQLMQMGAQPVAPPSPPPRVGGWETYWLRGSQALPAGGLVTDLVSTALVEAGKRGLLPGGRDVEGQRATLTPEARAELEASGGQVAQPEGALDTYRDIRDTRRLRTAAGSQQNPGPARLGTATGIVASIAAPLPKTTFGAVRDANGVLQMSRLARIGNAAATGGAYGTLNGATEGDADLTMGDVGGFLKDTASGAVMGTLTGGILGGAVEMARPLAGALRRFAVRQGKQTIQGGSDIAAATREPLADEAVETVLQSGGIKPFSTTQATAQRIETLARESGDEYGRIVAALEAQGVRGPDARKLADELMERGAQLEPRTLNEALPAEFLRRAEQVAGKGQQDGRLGLTQAEDLKRSMQDMARYGKLEETPLNAVRREVASVLRQANENAVEEAGKAAGAGSPLRALADRFVPVKQRTGQLLEAERFAQKGASKAEQRSPVTFKDLLWGSTAGEPVSGLALTVGSSIARNRLPSTLSAGSFNLSEGLRTGSLSSDAALALGGAAELGAEEAQSRADRATIDPDTDPITAALIRALRTKPKKSGKSQKEAR